MQNNVRFMFLRNKSGQPVGCLAIRLSQMGSYADYQVSVLNPADKFDRATARNVALERLEKRPYSVNHRPAFNGMNHVNRAIMHHLVNLKDVPNRARRAARLWLSQTL